MKMVSNRVGTSNMISTLTFANNMMKNIFTLCIFCDNTPCSKNRALKLIAKSVIFSTYLKFNSRPFLSYYS